MKQLNVGAPAFSPENIERIYFGEPALAEGDKFAGDVLSDRQYEIADLAAEGRHYKEISGELGVSVSTYKDSPAHYLQKLGSFLKIRPGCFLSY